MFPGFAAAFALQTGLSPPTHAPRVPCLRLMLLALSDSSMSLLASVAFLVQMVISLFCSDPDRSKLRFDYIAVISDCGTNEQAFTYCIMPWSVTSRNTKCLAKKSEQRGRYNFGNRSL